MRYARLRDSQQPATEAAPDPGARAALIAYNVVWWIPVVLPLLGLVSYRTGVVTFALVTVARAVINLYRNNVLPLDRAERFPLRLP